MQDPKELKTYLETLVKLHPDDAIAVLLYCFERINKQDRVIEHFISTHSAQK